MLLMLHSCYPLSGFDDPMDGAEARRTERLFFFFLFFLAIFFVGSAAASESRPCKTGYIGHWTPLQDGFHLPDSVYVRYAGRTLVCAGRWLRNCRFFVPMWASIHTDDGLGREKDQHARPYRGPVQLGERHASDGTEYCYGGNVNPEALHSLLEFPAALRTHLTS